MDSLKNSLTSATAPSSGSTYLSSNSVVGKLVFVIMVVIVFVLLFQVGLYLIVWYNSPPKDPFLIKGMLDGSHKMTIKQDPSNADSVQILRSNNDDAGAAFTWSLWLYIQDFDINNGEFYHVFSKGDENFAGGDKGQAAVNNAPGLYLGKPGDATTAAPPAGKNNQGITLRVKMDSVKVYDAKVYVDVPNMPIRKWVHVALRLENTVFDVYVNGQISGRLLLSYIPKQNYSDVLIHHNGGFKGKTSDLRYYSRSLNIFQIQRIVDRGPDTSNSKMADELTNVGNYGYLGYNWYSEKLM